MIELKKYDQAIEIVNKVIKGDPKSFYTIIKGGIIYQDYLNNKNMAKTYFEKANLLALKNLAQNKNIDNDYKVAFSLIFLKDKKTSLNYLTNAKLYYKRDLKATSTLDSLRKLIENTNLNKESNFNIFKQYHSELY